MSDATWTGMQEAAGLSALPGFLAGTPVAVLAGFNLATAILVVSQRPNPDKWAIWASASSTCLFLGAAAFLVTMALSGRAQFLALDPAQAAAWWPEVALNEANLKSVRNRVWESQKRVADLIQKASFIWIAGLVLTAAGAGSGVLSYKINFGHWLAAGALLLGAAVVAFVVFWPLNLGANNSAAPELSEGAKKLFLA